MVELENMTHFTIFLVFEMVEIFHQGVGERRLLFDVDLIIDLEHFSLSRVFCFLKLVLLDHFSIESFSISIVFS